jgi:DNA-binding winged helix-turn-helix (wHTH) protein
MTAPPNPTSITLAREPVFRLGGLEVRPPTREVIGTKGSEVLEPRVMQVLVVLAKANGDVVTRDDLLTLCWEGRVVGDDALNRVIGKIRRLARTDAGFALETIRKVGYRLVASESPAAGQATEVGADVPAKAPQGMSRRARWPWFAAALGITMLVAWAAFAAVLPQTRGGNLADNGVAQPAGGVRIPVDPAVAAEAQAAIASLFESGPLDLAVADTPPGRPMTGAAAPELPLPDAGASSQPMSLLPPD